MSNENFYSYLHGEKLPSSQDESMSGHDKRYHPHGYHKGDKCEKRDSLERVDDISSIGVISEDEYYKPIVESFTPDTARGWLWENCGIECVHLLDANELHTDLMFPSSEVTMFKGLGQPISENAFAQDCVLMGAVCKDLSDRFGKIPFDSPLFIPFDFSQSLGWYAMSTTDRRDKDMKENYISLGDIELDRKILGEKTFPYILRHEIGHSLTTQEITREFQTIKTSIIDKEGTDRYIRHVRERLGGFALKNDDETVAEAFAVYTSPSYRHRTLHQELERFVETMLHPKNSSSRGTTMDAQSSNTSLPVVNPVYLIVGDSFNDRYENGLSWFDMGEQKTIEFQTYADKARYILSKNGVSTEIIETVLSRFPTREWNCSEIVAIRNLYRYCGCSAEEICKRLGK